MVSVTQTRFDSEPLDRLIRTVYGNMSRRNGLIATLTQVEWYLDIRAHRRFLCMRFDFPHITPSDLNCQFEVTEDFVRDRDLDVFADFCVRCVQEAVTDPEFVAANERAVVQSHLRRERGTTTFRVSSLSIPDTYRPPSVTPAKPSPKPVPVPKPKPIGGMRGVRGGLQKSLIEIKAITFTRRTRKP